MSNRRMIVTVQTEGFPGKNTWVISNSNLIQRQRVEKTEEGHFDSDPKTQFLLISGYIDESQSNPHAEPPAEFTTEGD